MCVEIFQNECVSAKASASESLYVSVCPCMCSCVINYVILKRTINLENKMCLVMYSLSSYLRQSNPPVIICPPILNKMKRRKERKNGNSIF